MRSALGGARRDLGPRLLVNESLNNGNNNSFDGGGNNGGTNFSNPNFVTTTTSRTTTSTTTTQQEHGPTTSTTTTGVEDFERDIWPQIVDGNAFENQLIVLNFLPTGCEGIDDVLAGGTSETGESLGGGLRQGQVTEITGECGSGKTQLCLSAAASAATLGHRVVFVDTNGVFSAERIKAFHRNFWSDEATEEEITAHLDKTLELIAVHDVHDVFTLLHLLDQLQQDATEEDDNPEKSDTMGLLVIDSLSLLLAPLLTRAHHQGHTVMTMVAVMLKAIATERKAAVLYTNHTVADTSSSGDFNSVGNYGAQKYHQQQNTPRETLSSLKPALGVRWTSVPHRRLQLSKVDGNQDGEFATAVGDFTTPPECTKIKAEVVYGGGQNKNGSACAFFQIQQNSLQTLPQNH